MPLASRFDNLVVLNLIRLLETPEEAAEELLTVAGILMKYVLSKPGVSTQADVDKAMLQALVNMHKIRPGKKYSDHGEVTPSTKPDAKIIGLLTSGWDDTTKMALTEALPLCLGGRLAAVVKDAESSGKGGISALILDRRSAPTGAVEAFLRYQTVTLSYTAPPASEETQEKHKTADPTWGFSYSHWDATFDYEAVRNESGKRQWETFLKNVPQMDVTGLDSYFEIKMDDGMSSFRKDLDPNAKEGVGPGQYVHPE